MFKLFYLFLTLNNTCPNVCLMSRLYAGPCLDAKVDRDSENNLK